MTRLGRWFLVIFLSAGCVRAQIHTRAQSLRPTAMPALTDDLSFTDLTAALEADLKALSAKGDGNMIFGLRLITQPEYAASLKYLLSEAKADPSGERFRQALRDNFEAFEVYGLEDWGDVFITSYFEPVLEGSRQSTAQFSRPLYGLPKDLVTVDLTTFSATSPELIASHGLAARTLRGQILPGAKDQPARVVAYADRTRIDGGAIKDQAKVLAWVDPIDGFFLEIQGSGLVKFKDGKEMPVGYASQNGWAYEPVGKFLFDAIPKDKMTQAALEAHLRSLPPDQARKIMEMNPSYVFFRQLEHRGVTALGAEVVAGRTIATDASFFPKGALAYMEFQKPVFNAPTDVEAASWQPTARFVLDQDTGGAIRGPHRVDLFWGRGAEAKQAAGVMKNHGRLVYFVPRSEFLARLR